MERVTISVSDEFAAELAVFMAANRYDNKSEATPATWRVWAFGRGTHTTIHAEPASQRLATCSTITFANSRSG